MYKVPVQNKRWHPILDRFRRIRCSIPDYGPYLLEGRLNVSREARNVFVDILGCCRFHIAMSSRIRMGCAAELLDQRTTRAPIRARLAFLTSSDTLRL